MADIYPAPIALAAFFLCRRYTLCGFSAAFELEFRRIFLLVPGAVLRKRFQMEIRLVERLVLGIGLGVFQLPLPPGDRMVRPLAAGPGTGTVAGTVGSTAAQTPGMDDLSC